MRRAWRSCAASRVEWGGRPVRRERKKSFAGFDRVAGLKGMTRHGILLRFRGFLLLLAGAVGLLSPSLAHASETKSFSIPASTAERSLKEFSSQSGVELVYPGEIVRGVRTPAVTGDLTPGEALSRLLRGTGLTSVQDQNTGAFSIARASDPNVRRAAQATPSDRPRPNS